jgi:hypothetical protein
MPSRWAPSSNTSWSTAYDDLCTLFDQQTADGSNTALYDGLLKKAVESIVSTFRKRVATGLQTGRSFKIPDQKDQANDTTDFELVTWLVINKAEGKRQKAEA